MLKISIFYKFIFCFSMMNSLYSFVQYEDFDRFVNRLNLQDNDKKEFEEFYALFLNNHSSIQSPYRERRLLRFQEQAIGFLEYKRPDLYERVINLLPNEDPIMRKSLRAFLVRYAVYEDFLQAKEEGACYQEAKKTDLWHKVKYVASEVNIRVKKLFFGGPKHYST